MLITVNGEQKNVPDDLSVQGLLEHLQIPQQRVAVELNEMIVRKATYAATLVKQGDFLEIVSFMGGGAAALQIAQIPEY